MEEIVTNTCSKPAEAAALERRTRPHKDQALNCPRCNSTNTKFCYYNNYSLTQPRYFCKTCRRYWTEGGSLRNIPVGGGSRKNKRSSSSSLSSSSSSSSTSSKKLHDHLSSTENPKTTQDLNLSQSVSEFVQIPSSSSALELLTGFSSRSLNSLMPMTIGSETNAVYANGFSLPTTGEFKQTLNFSLDGYGVQETSGRLLFPYEDLKQISTTTTNDHIEHNRDPTGYWNGMLGGGSW